MSQAQLAEKLNVTRQTISSWERGASFPDLGMLEEIAKVFGIEVSEILYPQAKKKQIFSRNEPMSLGFAILSAVLYFAAYVTVLAFTGAMEESVLLAVTLLVGYIGLCTCMITQYIVDALRDIQASASE